MITRTARSEGASSAQIREGLSRLQAQIIPFRKPTQAPSERRAA